MALQDKLEKKQQEKCQPTLTSEPRPTQKFTPAAPAPAVKFSNDIERLQQINRIQKAPPEAQIKRVTDLLLETRLALTPEEINERCHVAVNTNKTVFDSLRKNPKVNYDGKCFSYKPKHDLKGKSQLLIVIRKFPEGIDVTDLKDAYPNVMEDLQALKAQGQIWLLEDIAYPNDPRVVPIKVNNDFKLLFHRIELPCDMLDIEKDLQKNGMRPATNTEKRRAQAQVQGILSKPETKKKLEISKRTKLTNVHIPELFQNIKA